MAEIRIDQLNPTVLPSELHEFPAMKDGVTVKLTVDQVVGIAKGEIIDTPVTATGTVDDIEVDGVVATLEAGQLLIFTASGDNTGATTINWNALGVKDIKKIVSGVPVALVPGDIKSAAYTFVIYDGTQFILVWPGTDIASLTPTDGNFIVGDGVRWKSTSKFTYNWLINGNFTINQRVGIKVPAVGVYGYDRWKGHASGIEQVVESLPAGEYTLTWTGGGSAAFGGTTSTSPFKATVVAGNASVIVPGTSTEISLVLGDHTDGPDPWVDSPEQEELLRCLRYYVTGITGAAGGLSVGSGYLSGNVSYPVPLRTTPTLTQSGQTYFNINANNIILGSMPSSGGQTDRLGFGHYAVNDAVATSYTFTYTADAEL